VFGGAGMVAGMGRQTLACALVIMVLRPVAITANGTAVEGVCATGAIHRLIVPVVELGRVPVGRQYGAVFAK